MIVFSYYPADPRVRREAEALAENGFSVHVLALRGSLQSSGETIRNVSVCRLPMQRKRGGKIRYVWEYLAFIIMAFLQVSFLHLRLKFDVVHIHNMPDILVLSGLFPKLNKAKIILDLHDPMPEVFMTKYSLKSDHKLLRILYFLEKISIGMSDMVLTPNIAFRDLFVSRGCPASKIEIVMNSPDDTFVSSDFCSVGAPLSIDDNLTFHLMFHGLIAERHGLETSLQAIMQVKSHIPKIKYHVYGEGDFVGHFLDVVKQLGLGNIVEYYGFVSQKEIAAAIKKIDLGLIPNKRSPFTEINMPTRIFEYLCNGKPVIVPRTKGIKDYFGERDIFYFEPGDSTSLAEMIRKVYENDSLRKDTVHFGVQVYKKHEWKHQKRNLLNSVRPKTP